MKKILLTVAYDGTEYSGWQIQPNAKTVEGTLRAAIEKLTGTVPETIGGSRTDAGVHALGNIVTFETDSPIPPERYSRALNSFLPQDIRVLHSCEKEMDFHPLRVPHKKRYEYRISEGEVVNPLRVRFVHHVYETLSVENMNRAAALFAGEHDFSSFCSAGAQVESKIRTVTACNVYLENDEIVIAVEGNGFLYNMIRILAGTLIEIGRGAMAPEQMKEILEAKNRSAAGPTAPPQGLTLIWNRCVEE